MWSPTRSTPALGAAALQAEPPKALAGLLNDKVCCPKARAYLAMPDPSQVVLWPR